MSGGAIGGLTAAATAISALGKPQSNEVRVTPKQDSSSATGATAVTPSPVKPAAGRIDIKV